MHLPVLLLLDGHAGLPYPDVKAGIKLRLLRSQSTHFANLRTLGLGTISLDSCRLPNTPPEPRAVRRTKPPYFTTPLFNMSDAQEFIKCCSARLAKYFSLCQFVWLGRNVTVDRPRTAVGL